jgi:tRNA (cmo5U34)-methyltransferase
MRDPVERHPTRAEQLDILATLVCEGAGPDERLLDLGCGKGYVAQLILQQRPDLRITGIDRSAAALEEARVNLGPWAERVTLLARDLERFPELDLDAASFRFVLSALTFHDLSDSAKQTVITRAGQLLAPGGCFLLYDRLRLTEPSLFSLQQSIWRRIERVHGRGMRTAESFEAYLADIGSDNRPASLEEYFAWFRAAGLAPACLHLHGNVALLAGGRPQ